MSATKKQGAKSAQADEGLKSRVDTEYRKALSGIPVELRTAENLAKAMGKTSLMVNAYLNENPVFASGLIGWKSAKR